MPVRDLTFCEHRGPAMILRAPGLPGFTPEPPASLLSRMQRVNARPKSHLPNPGITKYISTTLSPSKVSKSKPISYKGGPFLVKTQKNLIFGPEAVDCGGKPAAKTINLCRVPQLARAVKKIIPQQNQ